MKTTEDIHGNLHVMPYEVDSEWEHEPLNVARAVLRGVLIVFGIAFCLWLGHEIGCGIDSLGKIPR